jgi:hypothetical protein
MKTHLVILFSLILPLSAAPIKDSFADGSLHEATRGKWTYAEKVASCTSDPELYKKFKNHGPIIRWSSEFVDGSTSFDFKPTDCQRLVFTFNGDGHIFRVILMDAQKTGRKVTSRILAWAEKSSKTNKGTTINPEGLPNLPALDKKWTKLSIVVNDGSADLTLGDFKTTLKHPALKRAKNSITLSFASGKIDMRNFKHAPKTAPKK